MNKLLFAVIYTCISISPALAGNDSVNPEIATQAVHGHSQRKATIAHKFMVSAANPLATQAGVKILKSGGNALDAAIAVQMALNVVEPQSSGIGGGAFLLYYSVKDNKLHVYDGRETAPAGVKENLFLDKEGKPLPFLEAEKGGRSVGTPGVLRMLDMAHRKYGKKNWSSLFEPAVKLAKEGFPFSPRLHGQLANTPHVYDFPKAMKPYVDAQGKLLPMNTQITNPELAKSLYAIGNQGIRVFYEGKIAQDMVKAVQQSPYSQGSLSLDDLKHYKAVEREPMCGDFRSYTVCSMPPPSSGGAIILMAMGILDALPVDIATLAPAGLEAAHYFTEASSLAYADRNRYLADPAFSKVPLDKLLDKGYLARRSAMIQPDKAMPKPKAGLEEHPSTTHISIIDEEGNAVSMTSSIEYAFGSGVSVDGFFLNNQLTDFNFSPTLEDGKTLHPNRVQPNKRPRSSMSPTIVFNKDKQVVLVVGSPGGGRIIEYVLQTLIGLIAWNMDIQEAINLPHYLNMNTKVELEKGSTLESLKPAMEKMGHKVVIADTPSGLHGVQKRDGLLLGGADMRREGLAAGE